MKFSVNLLKIFSGIKVCAKTFTAVFNEKWVK